MRRIALAAYLVWVMPGLALAQADPALRYVVAPDLASAHAISAAAWAAVKCDPVAMPGNCNPNDATKYVYPVVGLTNGQYAIVIRLGDLHAGESLSWNGKTYTLTPAQITFLSTHDRAAMGPLLPDILQVAFLNARVTIPETTAINAYKAAHPGAFTTNYNALISGPIDLQDTKVGLVFNELVAAGVLTQARVDAICAPNPAAAVVTD